MAGLGLREEHLHPEAGLRVMPWRARLRPSPGCIVGDTNIVDQTSWTALTISVARGMMPIPATLCVTFRNNNATPQFGQKLRFRAKGYGQFGEPVEEVTPLIELADNSGGGTPAQPFETRIHLSRVFSRVVSFEYQASDIDGSNDFVHVGFRPSYYEDYYLFGSGLSDTYQVVYPQNFGLGLPLHTQRYGFGGSPSDGALDLLTVELTDATERAPIGIASYTFNAGANNDVITLASAHHLPTNAHGIIDIFGLTEGGTGSMTPSYVYPRRVAVAATGGTTLRISGTPGNSETWNSETADYTADNSGMATVTVTADTSYVRFAPGLATILRPAATGAPGFVIGRSDGTLAWQGDANKVGFTGDLSTGAVYGDRASPGGAGKPVSLGDDDDVDATFWVRTTALLQSELGGSAYPDKFVHTV